MTVQEFISELAKQDPKATIYIWQWNNGTPADYDVCGARSCPDGAVRISRNTISVAALEG